jgi:hypothetical protein
MWGEFYKASPYLLLPLLALGLFAAAFAAIVVRAVRPGARAEQEAAAHLPFDDGGDRDG